MPTLIIATDNSIVNLEAYHLEVQMPVQPDESVHT
jgi:hypothetical protein